jgi:hypothetical protein
MSSSGVAVLRWLGSLSSLGDVLEGNHDGDAGVNFKIARQTTPSYLCERNRYTRDSYIARLEYVGLFHKHEEGSTYLEQLERVCIHGIT